MLAASSDTVVFGEENDRHNIADMLGKRIVKEVPAGGDLSMKRYLAKHFGRKMGEDEMEHPPQKAESYKTRTQEVICIRTLEEIKQEKSQGQAQGQGEHPLPSVPDTTTSIKAPKRIVIAKPATSLYVKTFSEILHARRKLEEDLQQGQGPSLRKAKQQAVESVSGNSQAWGPTHLAMPRQVAPPVRGVKVKTLEEIRSEKAARMQAQGQEASNRKRTGSASDSGEGGAKKPYILRINKPASPAVSTTTQKTSEVTEKPAESAAVATEASPANSRSDTVSGASLKVKTFKESMCEKRLCLQQLVEEQASSTSQPEGSTSQPEGSAKAKSAQKRATGSDLQREKSMTPVIMRVIPSAASLPPSFHTITLEVLAQAPKAPLCQGITLKPKAVSPAAAFSQQGSPLRQVEADPHSLSCRSSSAAPGKRKTGSPGGASPAKQAALAAADSPGPSVDEDLVEKAQDGSQKKSPGQATEVRPKLNMRSSVMKQAAQIKPSQKRTRKAADTYAAAAVKRTPLNSTSAAQEELLQEPPCKWKEGSSPSSVEAQMSLVVPRSPLSSPVVISRSAMEANSASSSSTMDEFDKLMNEFLGYYHEFNCELDPCKGFNDLLLELNNTPFTTLVH